MTDSTHTRPKVNRHGEEIHEFLVRLEAPLYEKLKDRVHTERSTKAEVIRNALRSYL